MGIRDALRRATHRYIQHFSERHKLGTPRFSDAQPYHFGKQISFKQDFSHKRLVLGLFPVFHLLPPGLHNEKTSHLHTQCFTLLRTMSLETLPSELKLNVLRQVDFPTLRALVHASPTYHALYRSSRLEILTSATFFHLETVGFNPEPISQWYKRCENTQHGDYWCLMVRLPGFNNSKAPLEAAFESYWRELEEQGVHNHQIKLSLNYCTALLAIEKIKGYATINKAHRYMRDHDDDGAPGNSRFRHMRMEKASPLTVKHDGHYEFLTSKSLRKR